MPNVLDIDPLRALARRAGTKIGDAKIAARFERIALDRLLKDSRNFRAATAAELQQAPDWARAAQARGETVSVFAANRGNASRLHIVARRLGETCKLAAADAAARPAHVAIIAAARVFLSKFDRASFDVAARKALNFSRALAAWDEDRDAEPVCAMGTIAATHGRMWERVTSVAELRAVGREFRNCLARTMRNGAYGGMLCQGLAQFWVLRDHNRAGLVIAMAPAPIATQLTEVRGPRNTHINPDHIDLVRLARAIGVRPTDPPPPPPPLRVAVLALASGQPCLCVLCNPLIRRVSRTPLRERAPAP